MNDSGRAVVNRGITGDIASGGATCRGRTLSIVAPTYNEVDNVEPLVAALETNLLDVDFELIICDDDSPDLTWSCAEQIARRNPRVRVIRRTSNRGLGQAVVEGFSAATADVVACIDADLQHDPAILPEMLAQLRAGADLVVGSRYVGGGGTSNWNFLRRMESRVATILARRLLKVELRDPMSGYFLLRKNDFARVKNRLNPEGFKILLEIVAQVRPRRLVEVPYTFRKRERGASKLSSKIVVAYLRQLWRLSSFRQSGLTEFLKFAAVGSIGVIVNLTVMTMLLQLTDYRDWRASAFASLTAMLNNYLLNNFWTFRDRSHAGVTLFGRYFLYVVLSMAGLTVTTAFYAVITTAIGRIATGSSALPTSLLLVCQLISISVGTVCNYVLNRSITWPETARANTKN